MGVDRQPGDGTMSPAKKPARKKVTKPKTDQKADTLVNLAELIALCRVTRLIRDEKGTITGVERIDHQRVGTRVDPTPEDLLKADSFIGHHRRRPMA
jgi:hypothetical protein